MKQIDKNALVDWEKYKEDVYRSTPVDQSMSHAEREKHRLYLEAHPIEWIKFFYPGYAKYEFADNIDSLSGSLAAARQDIGDLQTDIQEKASSSDVEAALAEKADIDDVEADTGMVRLKLTDKEKDYIVRCRRTRF